jgi:hypothetical protein
MWPLFTGFMGGIVAWIFTTILGQPLQRLIHLRQQAALVLAQYDDLPWIGNPEAKPPEDAWIKERREAYDKIGSELVAFADANSFITRQLYRRFPRRYRIYVRNAGDELRTLGATRPGTESWAQTRKSAKSALKIAD